MVKTLEDFVREHLGALTLQVLMLTAENAQLKASLEGSAKSPQKDSDGR